MSAKAALAHHTRATLDTLLPPRLAARLAEHCAATGDDDADVVADAVMFYLDEADERAERAEQERQARDSERFADGLLACIGDLP